QATLSIADENRVGTLVARQIKDTLDWGEGSILPQSFFNSLMGQQALLDAVLASIEPVTDQEASFSSCTDGRIPLKLMSDEAVPVREQMVGADMVSAFYVAETLGPNFYKNPAASVAERVREVAEFLHDNGIKPSSHIGCGAAAGFTLITENAVRFSANPAYIARIRSLLPAGIYDRAMHDEMLKGNKKRLEANLYEGLTAQTFLDIVEQISGVRAIAELNNDGRGVHCHVEEQIIRVRVPGCAIDEAKVARLTGGREVFGVNDRRLERLARLFSRGNDSDYRKAYMALEDFADTGHGTLAKDLPTYIIESAA
ncbi:MAG: hypothetical protein AAB834_03060, partial [Patescibacteria group bacterium]